MPRYNSNEGTSLIPLPQLFTEEAAKSSQSRMFHLITLMVSDSADVYGTMSAGSSYLFVTDPSNFYVGQYLTVEGLDGRRRILAIDGDQITLDSPAETQVVEAIVHYTLALNVVDSNYDITYDSVVYSRFPVKFSEVSQNSDGSIDKASVTVANVSREIQFYVEKFSGLRGCTVTVKAVYERFLDYLYSVSDTGEVTTQVNPEADSLARMEDQFLIDSYLATEEVIVFQLDPIIDFDIKLPRRRFLADACYWRFKGPECGYAGEATFCDKTLKTCKSFGNQSRYGGFPGIAGQKRVWL